VVEVWFDADQRWLDPRVDFAKPPRLSCSQCGRQACARCMSGRENLDHLDLINQAYLTARGPPAIRPEHKIKHARVPPARESSGFRRLVEALVEEGCLSRRWRR
jgi:hypothetical protein